MKSAPSTLSVLAALSSLASVLAADNIPNCGNGLPACPEKYPCCSTEGTCGNGYVCLGGCDPRFSYEPGACVAMPVCKSQTYNFSGTDGIASYSDYMGDVSKNAWSYLGNITAGTGNSVRTQMFQGTQGTSISSSDYIWYGKIDIVAKTAGTPGVVTDAILLSNVKDELDWEFVGASTTAPQTNYYWQASTGNGNEIDAHTSATDQSYHTFTLDWQEDQVTWLIDGQQQRQLKKSDTYNATSKIYEYPQTPARIQFGIWPAGDSAAQGTSEWAGGKIDWNSPAYTANGYFYLEVESITVQCYDPPSGTQTNGSTSYVYTNSQGLESQVAITDDSTILGSTDGTGLNLNGSLATTASSSKAAAFTLSGASTASTASTTTKGAAVTLSGASEAHTTTSSSKGPAVTISETSSSASSTSGSGSGKGSDSGSSSSDASDASATASASSQSGAKTSPTPSATSSAASSSPSSSAAKANDSTVAFIAPLAAIAAALASLL